MPLACYNLEKFHRREQNHDHIDHAATASVRERFRGRVSDAEHQAEFSDHEVIVIERTKGDDKTKIHARRETRITESQELSEKRLP